MRTISVLACLAGAMAGPATAQDIAGLSVAGTCASVPILPAAIHATRLTASENVVLMGAALAVWGFLRALRRPTVAAAALGGVLLGLSMLIKALLVMAAPALFAAIILRMTDRPP